MDDESAQSYDLLPGVRGQLRVGLSEPAELITEKLYNRRATAAATIESIRLEVYAIEDDTERELSEAELSAVVFEQPDIVIRGLGAPVRHIAPNGVQFTVGDLLAAVEETERVTRPHSSWFGGVDVHHVFFEGLCRDAEGVWQIRWGS